MFGERLADPVACPQLNAEMEWPKVAIGRRTLYAQRLCQPEGANRSIASNRKSRSKTSILDTLNQLGCM